MITQDIRNIANYIATTATKDLRRARVVSCLEDIAKRAEGLENSIPRTPEEAGDLPAEVINIARLLHARKVRRGMITSNDGGGRGMTNTPEKKTPDTIAFCYASGKIKFGLMMPKGVLPIVRGKGRRIRELVSARARLAYDGKTLLVPGIPEADSEEERFAAFKRFSDWIQGTLDKDAEIDAWNAAHPKGTRVIVHSTVGDYACKAHGRTTTKARLSGGKIVVRVQHSGENRWTDIDVLTFPEGN